MGNKMNYKDQMNEMSKAMHFAFLDEETKIANDLREKSTSLTLQMFQPNPDLSVIVGEIAQVAKQMLAFEKEIINFSIMNFFYADVSRTLLNIRQYEFAVNYALAGIEVNKRENDNEGIVSNLRVLLDTACYMGASQCAIELLDAYPELELAGLRHQLEIKPVDESADTEFKKLIESKKRPSSYPFCIDVDKGREETMIRSLMRQLGDSRSTVMEYLSTAKQMNKNNK